jgi:hypothetical protein
MMKQWAKREEQIMRVMGATVGMYGDLRESPGKSLQEIEGLELKSLGLYGETCNSQCRTAGAGNPSVRRLPYRS